MLPTPKVTGTPLDNVDEVSTEHPNGKPKNPTIFAEPLRPDQLPKSPDQIAAEVLQEQERAANRIRAVRALLLMIATGPLAAAAWLVCWTLAFLAADVARAALRILLAP